MDQITVRFFIGFSVLLVVGLIIGFIAAIKDRNEIALAIASFGSFAIVCYLIGWAIEFLFL